MTRGDVGRVLAASLHQAIADELPTRLEFYESWLRPEGLRDGRIGVAPFNAVLSFLRQESAPYRVVVGRAGGYAADWTISELSPARRALLRGAPAWLRRRLVLGVARDLVRRSFPGAGASASWRKGVGQLEIRGSAFCGVRDPSPDPLCGFYAAAVKGLMAAFGLVMEARVDRCRATDRQQTCLMTVQAEG